MQEKSIDETAGGGGDGGGFLEEMAFSGTLKITAVPEEEGEMWKGPVDNGNRKGWVLDGGVLSGRGGMGLTWGLPFQMSTRQMELRERVR